MPTQKRIKVTPEAARKIAGMGDDLLAELAADLADDEPAPEVASLASTSGPGPARHSRRRSCMTRRRS